jgi:hypothetical protein
MRSNSRRILAALVAVLAVGAVSAAPALASGKPFVETKPPTSVTEEGATLNGVVNPNGAETKYYFEYGETTSYGKKTAEASAGSGTSNLEVSKAITGLSLLKTYHFRVVATNSNGTTDGSDESFGRPSAATKLAVRTSGTGATLCGAVTPNGLETKYWFEYGTEKGKLTTKTAEASAGSGKTSVEEEKVISGLTEGTKYYYRIAAKNGKGRVSGSEKVFTAAVEPEFSISPLEFKGTFRQATIEFEATTASYESGTISGKITGRNEVGDVILTFVGGNPADCDNVEVEKRPYELVTNELVGSIGYINKASKTVGLLLESPTGVVAKCNSTDLGSDEYFGSVIGGLTPVNNETKSYKMTIEMETGKQKIEKFEGEEVLHHLEGMISGGNRKGLWLETKELKLEFPIEEELRA